MRLPPQSPPVDRRRYRPLPPGASTEAPPMAVIKFADGRQVVVRAQYVPLAVACGACHVVLCEADTLQGL